MNSFPFESKNIGTASAPIYDRAITAEMERQYNICKYTNGVFTTPITSLMVDATSGMMVAVRSGGCHINGAIGYQSEDASFTIDTSSSNPRIDRIVARFDTSEDYRNIELYVLKGNASTNPTPPAIRQEDNYYEIVLADIFVRAGATEISASDITDRRADSSVCGFVVPAIPSSGQFDELWSQLKSSIDLVEASLTNTQAGNLQNQINAISAVARDTGWVEVPVSVQTSSAPPMVRRIGDICFLAGEVGLTEFGRDGWYREILAIPDGFSPSQDMSFTVHSVDNEYVANIKFAENNFEAFIEDASNSNPEIITRIKYSGTQTFSNYYSLGITADNIDGYTPVAFVPLGADNGTSGTGRQNCAVAYSNMDGNSISITLKNTSTSQVTVRAKAMIIYQKDVHRETSVSTTLPLYASWITEDEFPEV